jgi:hypothetical protein
VVFFNLQVMASNMKMADAMAKTTKVSTDPMHIISADIKKKQWHVENGYDMKSLKPLSSCVSTGALSC